MIKKGLVLNYNIAIGQIFIVFVFVFAFSFLISQVSTASAFFNNPSSGPGVASAGYANDRYINYGGNDVLFRESYQNGELEYALGGERLSYEEAAKVAKDSGVDISQSAGFALKNSLAGNTAELGSLAAGQNLGNGVSVVSRNVLNEETTIVLKDASGATQTLTGSSTDTVGSAVKSANTPASSGGILDSIFGKTPLGTSPGPFAALLSGLIWGGVAALAVKMIGGMFGLDKGTTNALSLAAFGGVAVYRSLSLKLFPSLTKYALPIGIGVGAAIFIFMYKKEKKQIIQFSCLPFEPPIGGAKCEECNKDPFRPCSEYRCKSLGQACQILNAGTAEERCAWVNPGDVTSPTIQPWIDALKPGDLKYIPDNAIRPPSRGVKIVRGGNGCLQAYTPLEFGIFLNEPSQCKIDWNRNATFAEMQFYFGESNYFRYNHTQKMRLPGPDAGQSASPLIANDGTFNLYVRCMDGNGNVNPAEGNVNVDEFVFEFCVDPSPDTTPPIIEGTSITDKSPVQYNADNVPIQVYTNEPSECKWSRQDKAFEDMENTMTCNTESFQVNADLQYTCSGDLSGIQNQQENKFYFRCKDQPDKAENDRNVNTASFPLTLRGSQPLNILSVGPNETIRGSTDTVPIELSVRTDDGADEGKAICYFSPTGEPDTFIAMFETNNFVHKQLLDLTSGNYEYHFRCIDAGGNAAEAETRFNVFIDRSAPEISRVYRDSTESALKVVTNEDAQCVYSIQSCNYVFNEGLALIYSNPEIKNVHFAEWKPTATYYIKCRDDQGNEPGPNECSVVASAVTLGNG